MTTDNRSAPLPGGVAGAWSKAPERSNMTMLRVMTWISLRLGRPVARLVLQGIAFYFMLLAPKSRAASRAYLARVLRREPSWRDIYRHFFSFASTVHDRVFLLNNRFDLFDIEVHGESWMQDACANGQGAFLIGAHLGSFEVIRALGRHHAGLKVAMAMYEENAQKINSMLAAINPDARQDIVALGHIDSMIKIHQHLADGTVVGMLADRSLPGDPMTPVTLLGAQALLSAGPFRMASIMKRPVIFMTGLYLGQNRYAIHFEPIADFSAVSRAQRQEEIDRAMRRYAGLLEKYCHLAPYNWFNFYDFWQVSLPSSPSQ